MALPVEQPRIASGLLKQSWGTVRGWPWPTLGTLAGVLLLLSLSLIGYQISAQPVTLVVDGTTIPLRTHHRWVGGVLEQAGLSLEPGDQVYPSPAQPWQPGQAIVVRRAFPTTVYADGGHIQLYGRPHSLLELFTQAGLTLRPSDRVYVNGEPVPESAYADQHALLALLSRQPGGGRLNAAPPSQPALQVVVRRAIPLRVEEGGLVTEVRTTAETVGAALEQAGLHIYSADVVHPPLDTPVSAGLQVSIVRAIPLQITADGRSYTTRTQANTVRELLREEGISLDPLDRVRPTLSSPLKAGMSIRVVRVTTLEVTEAITIPFTYRQEPDPTLELDQQYLQPGEEGLKEEVTKITYEDGWQVDQAYLGERTVREPVDQVLFYGTRIVIRTLDTPHGPVEYWRKLRVLATSYFPSTCDKSPDHPLYGITYTGRRATRGIIAIDPRIIPFHTRMYVPGYGLGVAEDIGGAIKGRHIDLCFDDADWGKGLWSTRYVDVYLLTPVPPPERIRWIIP